MKKVKCALLLLLAVALLMSGCALGTKAEETVAPTAAPTVAPTEVPTEAPTEAPTEPEEPGLVGGFFMEKIWLSRIDIVCILAYNLQ